MLLMRQLLIRVSTPFYSVLFNFRRDIVVPCNTVRFVIRMSFLGKFYVVTEYEDGIIYKSKRVYTFKEAWNILRSLKTKGHYHA